MRLLLDTNILIPLEDSNLPLENSMAHVVQLAHANGHELVYHPATEAEIQRDSNVARRQQTLKRLRQYSCLEKSTTPCPWNTEDTKPHDREDNEILYALKCDAAHILITEDKGIHDTAWDKGLGDRVFTIQTMEDWLQRLHERGVLTKERYHILNVSVHM
ncbi:MAG: N-acetyltransferase, partial [Magnetococcales bacterium]|nr:N-acetyltransferase [Magnetococcales bacterium]